MTERSRRRAGLEDIPLRISFAEDDLDTLEAEIKEVRGEMADLKAATDNRFTKFMWAVVSLAMTVAASAISFAYARGR